MSRVDLVVKLKQMLIGKKITQQSIADELGISVGAVSNFINGRDASKRINAWFVENLNIDVERLRMTRKMQKRIVKKRINA